MESRLFLPQLRKARLDVFPRTDMAEDKYLEYIPFTWVGCYAMGKPAKTRILWDMMLISMSNYQADEYMEAVVSVHFEHDLQPIRLLIERLCQEPEEMSMTNKFRKSESLPTSEELRDTSEAKSGIGNPSGAMVTIEDIELVLSRFVEFVMCHSKVHQSAKAAQSRLRHELKTFLLAHVTQIEDNARFSRQPGHQNNVSTRYVSAKTSYYDWVRTTSADHTSCPYSFIFFTILISKPGEELFKTVKQKYLAEDLCQHLATMCRQYNDYGSIARDRLERNLNSVNFSEFAESRSAIPSVGNDTTNKELLREQGESKRKENLLWLAEYERDCFVMAMDKLRNEISEEIMDALDLFVRVTDLYGQIYVARDIASRMK